MCDIKQFEKELNNKIKYLVKLSNKKNGIRSEELYDDNSKTKICSVINDQILKIRDELTTMIQEITTKLVDK